MLMDTIQHLAGADWAYDITGSTLSAPADDDIVLRHKAARAFKLPTDLSGTVVEAEVAPSATATFTVLKNDVSVGTFQVNTSGALIAPTFTEASFAIGDRLELEMTTANSIDEVYFTFITVAP